jgi:hypothetical protein
MDVSRTRVLDVRGEGRLVVFHAIAALLTSLDTLRVYAYLVVQHPGEIHFSDRFTSFYSQNYTEGRGTERQRLPPPELRLPRARRLVVFSHLGQYDQWGFSIPISPLSVAPPGVEHLVVHLAVPNEPEAPLAGFSRDFTPLPELKRATIIFTPAERPWRIPKTPKETDPLGDLQVLVEALGVPVTVVGFDLVERRIDGAKDKLTGVTYVDTSAYRAHVGQEEWALFTREGEEGMLKSEHEREFSRKWGWVGKSAS